MEYPIDYSIYSVDEIVEIVEFLNLIEQYNPSNTQLNPVLIKKYARYQAIINNKAEEKSIDKAFKKQTNLSVYETMKAIMNNEDSAK